MHGCGLYNTLQEVNQVKCLPVCVCVFVCVGVVSYKHVNTNKYHNCVHTRLLRPLELKCTHAHIHVYSAQHIHIAKQSARAICASQGTCSKQVLCTVLHNLEPPEELAGGPTACFLLQVCHPNIRS